MPTINITKQRAAANALAESLKIPASLYEQAVARYEAISDHLEREGGALAQLEPRIYSQGSFKLGTVVTPINRAEGYDLDLACELEACDKGQQSQQELKELVGDEIKHYARMHSMQTPVEKPRCWHLDYRDHVTFHMDIVPAVPEDAATKDKLRSGVQPEWACYVDTAVAITDRDDDNYIVRSDDWPRSNPRGYADWFMSQAAKRFTDLVELRKAEQIPSYQWNSPLQTVVQILKRHRDVMFQNDPSNGPISIIITTLAAHLYQGEADLRDALVGVVDRLPSFEGVAEPRVENPVNPDENFADKWESKPERRSCYEAWRRRVREDIAELGRYVSKARAQAHFSEAFQESLATEDAAHLVGGNVPPAAAVPEVQMRHKPEPWTRLA